LRLAARAAAGDATRFREIGCRRSKATFAGCRHSGSARRRALVIANSITEFYRSANGDRWQLVRTEGPTMTLVRHVPNASSGGRTTDSTVADFLSIDGPGPEFAALRRLLDGATGDSPGV
jgi:hypothetical protein